MTCYPFPGGAVRGQSAGAAAGHARQHHVRDDTLARAHLAPCGAPQREAGVESGPQGGGACGHQPPQPQPVGGGGGKRHALPGGLSRGGGSKSAAFESRQALPGARRPQGCSKPAASAGTQYCIAHGGGRRCQHEGCTKGAVKGGGTQHCQARGGGRRCQHEGCSKSARAPGSVYCRLCLQREQPDDA